MNDIMKTVQASKGSNLLLKGVTKTIKCKKKEQKGCFLSMLLGTLRASLSGHLLTGKAFIGAGEGTIRTDYGYSIKKNSNSTTSFNKF